MTTKEKTVPKTMPTREQVEAEAEQAAARAAELRQQIWQADQEQAERQRQAQLQYDQQLVADYSRADLDAEVEQAKAAFDQALSTHPLVLTLADYATALRRRRLLVNEHLAALARIGQPTEGASLPSADLLPLHEYVVGAAERLAFDRTNGEIADLHARRETAGTEATR